MFDLTGKVVLLTGATGGLGKSIAKRMKKKIYATASTSIKNMISYILTRCLGHTELNFIVSCWTKAY